MAATVCRWDTCPLPATSTNVYGEPECDYHEHVFADDWAEPAECGHCGGRGERRSLPHGEHDWSCRPCGGSGYADPAAGERYAQQWARRTRAYRRALGRHRRAAA